jgi:uncharacterized protein (TIGR03118 family)
MTKKLRNSWKIIVLSGMSVMCAILLPVLPVAAEYIVTNLVSDVSGLAVFTDSDLKNPWGITYSATSPFWVSNNGSGVATLYNGSGVKQSLVVTIPPSVGVGGGTPTGVVFNGSSSFNGDRFLFATTDGTIAGWKSGTTAVREVLMSDASYTGLALANNFLCAANFTAGKIDVFSEAYALTSLSGSFTDPALPAGYAPYNVQNFGGNLYVTYALATGTPTLGNGYVDVFGLDGNFEKRLISGGTLFSPWGLALAPADFGKFSNALLVANNGDGKINAFDAATGVLLGTLDDAKGIPIVIEGLRGLLFGNGGSAGDPKTLFFTAGSDGRSLLGSVAPVPVPPAFVLLGSGLLGLMGLRYRGCKH